MTLPEFLALKIGDRIANPMSNSAGAVTALVLDRRKQQEGVWIEWDGTSPDTARSFTTQTTAWMHWDREDLDRCLGLSKCKREDCRRTEQCLGGSIADYAGLP